MLTGGLDFLKEVAEVVAAPTTTNRFTEATPKELGGHTREEDVI